MRQRRPLPYAYVGYKNKALRCLWYLIWLILVRPTPAPLFGWRRALLRLFGAKMASGSRVYSNTKIWAPWNLTMAAHSCLARDVDCYCVAPVMLGAHVTVSQYSYLCTASHDFRDPAFRLLAAPIVIEDEAWIAADVFVGPGVTVRNGAVVGARSTVVADVESWTVVAGTPAVERGSRPPFRRG